MVLLGDIILAQIWVAFFFFTLNYFLLKNLGGVFLVDYIWKLVLQLIKQKIFILI